MYEFHAQFVDVIKGLANVLMGISHFNSRGYFHKDIKGDNLVVGVNVDQYRLLDYVCK